MRDRVKWRPIWSISRGVAQLSTEQKRSVDVLVVQCGPSEVEPAKNVRTNLELVRKAVKDRKPHVISFSELSTTQYFCGYNDPKWFDLAEPLDGPSVRAFKELAREIGCHVMLTFCRIRYRVRPDRLAHLL